VPAWARQGAHGGGSRSSPYARAVPVAGGGPKLGGRRGKAVEDVFPPADRRLVIPQATECGAVTRPAFRLRRQPTCPALELLAVHAWVRAEDP